MNSLLILIPSILFYCAKNVVATADNIDMEKLMDNFKVGFGGDSDSGSGDKSKTYGTGVKTVTGVSGVKTITGVSGVSTVTGLKGSMTGVTGKRTSVTGVSATASCTTPSKPTTILNDKQLQEMVKSVFGTKPTGHFDKKGRRVTYYKDNGIPIMFRKVIPPRGAPLPPMLHFEYVEGNSTCRCNCKI